MQRHRTGEPCLSLLLWDWQMVDEVNGKDCDSERVL